MWFWPKVRGRPNIGLGGLEMGVLEGEVQGKSTGQSEPSGVSEQNKDLLDLTPVYMVAIQTAKSKIAAVWNREVDLIKNNLSHIVLFMLHILLTRISGIVLRKLLTIIILKSQNIKKFITFLLWNHFLLQQRFNSF